MIVGDRGVGDGDIIFAEACTGSVNRTTPAAGMAVAKNAGSDDASSVLKVESATRRA